MLIFSKDGRTAYLAFVRNLPSQMVLLSPCFFLPRSKFFSWSESTDVLVWIAFLLMFVFAAASNILEFIEAANNKYVVQKTVLDLRSSGVTGWRLWVMTLRRSIKEFAGFIIVMLAVYGAFILVISMLFWTYSPKT